MPVVVFVPLLAQLPSQQCIDVHVLARLAAMTDRAGAFEPDYANGQLARSPAGVLYYPNGHEARRIDGTWLAPDGTIVGNLQQPVAPLVELSILEQLWQLSAI